MRDLVEDPKDFGPRVDSTELVSNRRRMPTICRTLEHGSNGFAQRLGRRFVGRKIDPDSCPYRKSSPGILVMETAKNWTAKNVSSALYPARYRRILAQ
jgi:hypothetical protein